MVQSTNKIVAVQDPRHAAIIVEVWCFIGMFWCSKYLLRTVRLCQKNVFKRLQAVSLKEPWGMGDGIAAEVTSVAG